MFRRRLFRLSKIIFNLYDMLRSVIEEECPFNYLVCFNTMALWDCFRKNNGSLPDYPTEEEMARSAFRVIFKQKSFQKKNTENSLSEYYWNLCGLHLDKRATRSQTSYWTKKLPISDSIMYIFTKNRTKKDLKDYEILSQILNSLVLKSTKKVSRKDLHFFTDEYNRVEVERARKFLLGIKKKLDKGAQELEPLFNAAVENLDSYSLCRDEISNKCDEVGLSKDRASQRPSSSPAPCGLSTSKQDAPDNLKCHSASIVPPRQIKFPLDSILAVVETDPSLNVKAIKKTLHEQTNESEKIDHAKKVLQKIGRNVESQSRAARHHPTNRWYVLSCFSNIVEGHVTDLYLRAVEDLNLYCLANGIDLDVNKSFNIEAPSLVDVTKFLDDHQVGVQNKHLIRAFLSTVGYPNSDSLAIAAAMRQTYNNFAEVSAGRQDLGDLHEVGLINLISASVIRNKVFEDINLAFVANTQRINEFLDTDGLKIPYMSELTLLNYLAFVGRYEDESIVKASRLPIPKWFPRPTSNNCHDRGKTKLYSKCVFNLFVAWQEINTRLSSERPEEPIFCAEFISKLVEQSAGNYSEALVEGIQNFYAVHEFDVYPDFLQPFFKENNHLCEFLDSNWDKILSNINIFRSLSVLATAGMPGTNVNDIVNIINSDKLRGFGNCHSIFEAVNLSKQLIIVAAATNQIHKLTVLKDPKGQNYVPTFESLLREIIYSEKSTDLALSKSKRISKAMRELKTYLFARYLKLPAFEELESFINSMITNEFAGQPDPLEFLDLFGESKNENNSDKFKRLADLPQIPLDNYPTSGIFDYLVATYRLVYSMKKAKVPLSMFKDANFPDLRYRDPKKILEYDELIDKNELSKADKILGQIYSIVKNDDGTAPDWFVEAAEGVNLLSLSNCGSPIDNWRGLEIADETVEDFKRGANLPERFTKDDELIRKFLVTYGLSKSGLLKKSRIIKAMQVRQEWSDFKDRIKAMKENDGEHSSIGSTDNQSSTENISQCGTQIL